MMIASSAIALDQNPSSIINHGRYPTKDMIFKPLRCWRRTEQPMAHGMAQHTSSPNILPGKSIRCFQGGTTPGGECWRSCCYFSSVQVLEVAFTHSPFNVRHGPNGFKDLQMLTANPCLSEHSRSTIRRSSTLA